MVRPRKSMEKTADQIRSELLTELNDAANVVHKPHHKVKNVFNYHPDCPYADRNTGICLESYYQYWKFYPKDTIQSDETIKHMNNDRADNRIENLVKWKKQKKPDFPVGNYMPAIRTGDKN